MSVYTGQVTRGGPPGVRELHALIVTKISVGPMDNNAYLLQCRSTGQQFLIDAAAEPEQLLSHVGPQGLAGIATTHRHRDHVGALIDLARATGAPTYSHADDADRLPLLPDVRLADGDDVVFGEVHLEALHLAGHTEGGLALAYDDPFGHGHVFVGDALFPGGLGSTSSEEQSFDQLFSDVSRKLFERWPDATWIYPGHGNDTTLGAERPQLPAWAARGW